MFPLLLAAGSALGAKSVQAHQLLGCGVGVGTAVAIGIVARQVSGKRAALLAATLAAIYPPLWLNDGGIMSEGLFALVTAGVILASYRLLRRRSLPAAGVLGVTIGLAVLTRSESVLFLGVLAVPLILGTPLLGAGRRAVLLSIVVLAALAVVSPWAVRNLTTFERAVPLGTGDSVLLGANCDPAYNGVTTGEWIVGCYGGTPAGDESVVAAAERSDGLSYAREHLRRLPVVVAIRVASVWQVYAPLRGAREDREDGRPEWAFPVALGAYAALVPLAMVGGLVLKNSRVSLVPLAAPIVSVTLTAALVAGTIRFRAPAEVALVVLAGVAIDAATVAGRGTPEREHDGA